LLDVCQHELASNETAPKNIQPKTEPARLSFVKVSADTGEPETNGDVANVDDVEAEEVEEEMVIRVVRPPGTGLGISIAGGVGATPFRGEDEVYFFVFYDNYS